MITDKPDTSTNINLLSNEAKEEIYVNSIRSKSEEIKSAEYYKDMLVELIHDDEAEDIYIRSITIYYDKDQRSIGRDDFIKSFRRFIEIEIISQKEEIERLKYELREMILEHPF